MGVDADLVVVGGGPAGSATAIGARLAGLSVVLVDPREPPVDKACGEGLMPGARTALEALGVQVHGREFHGIRYRSPGHEAEARFRGRPGLGVRRLELSRGLVARADEVGVHRLTARAGPPVQGPDWVSTAGVRARWLVAADGLHSPTRRALGLAVDPSRRRRHGLRRHYAVAPWTDLVEVHWAETAEAYVTPVDDTTVGVAVLSGGGAPFDRRLAEFPELADRLAGLPVVSADRGAGPLRQSARRRVAGRVLLVGDAAGYVDALTGEGIAVGLAAAREAVAAIVAEDPARYERRWRVVTRRYRLLTEALLRASRLPVVRRGIVPAAQRLPGAFSAVVRGLA
ncbi:MAG: NAD(P)/FAD-dependent oxidoreductase [Kineosporiaceae bacterium]